MDSAWWRVCVHQSQHDTINRRRRCWKFSMGETMSATSNNIAIRNRLQIPMFKPGKQPGPKIFSSGDMNVLVRAVNALLNPSVTWGEKDDVQITDGNCRINLNKAKAGSGASSQAVQPFMLTDVFSDVLACIPFSLPAGLVYQGFWSSRGSYPPDAVTFAGFISGENRFYVCSNSVGPVATAPQDDPDHWTLIDPSPAPAAGSEWVAKEFKTRTSLVSETIFDIEHLYTYDTGPDSLNLLRTNDDGTNAETEIIVPPWVNGELIFAIPAETGLLNPETSSAVEWLIAGRSAQWAKYP